VDSAWKQKNLETKSLSKYDLCIIPVIMRDALLGGFTLLLYAVHDCQNRIQVHATRHYQAVSLEIYPEYTQQLHDARNPVRESFAQLPVLPIWRVDG